MLFPVSKSEIIQLLHFYWKSPSLGSYLTSKDFRDQQNSNFPDLAIHPSRTTHLFLNFYIDTKGKKNIIIFQEILWGSGWKPPLQKLELQITKAFLFRQCVFCDWYNAPAPAPKAQRGWSKQASVYLQGVFRSARTSCTTFDWSRPVPSRPR